jgi:hypothetical protein
MMNDHDDGSQPPWQSGTKRQDSRFARPQAAPEGWSTGMCDMKYRLTGISPFLSVGRTWL